MPNDSREGDASDVEAQLPVDAELNDSSEDDVETTEPDLSSLRKAFEDVRAQTATRAEIESLRRQAGHVPALQRQIAELEGKLAQFDRVTERLDAYEMMLLDTLPPDGAERLISERSARTQEQLLDEKLKPILEKIAEPPATATDTVDTNAYAMAELEARITAATTFVKTEASRLGVDPETIPPEVWAGAQQKHGLDLEQASLEVLKYVNEQARKGSASDRRSARKEAAEGPSPSERSGSLGQYDLTTLKGAAQARKDGAITSEQFMETYRRIQRGL